jgi:HK97 family phage prohead protease
MEIRKTKGEIRENKLSGYAVLFNTPSVLIREHGKEFVETIERGAFDISDKEDDIKLYFQHNSEMPLARTRNGSLILREDEKGIYFEAELPNTSLANDVKELYRTGVLSGEMSFGFSVTRDKWSKDYKKRTVEKGKLYEISIVVDAAYPDTSSQLRDIQEINNKRISNIRRRLK